MPKVAQWPHNVAKMEANKGTTTFQPVVATIAKVFPGGNGKNPGWRFEEDTTPSGNYKGVIWNHAGRWDEKAGHSLPYDGPVGREGQRVRVTLKVKEGRDRNFHDVVDIRNAAQGEPEAYANADSPPESRETYQEPQPSTFMPTEVRIAKAQAFNALTSILTAKNEWLFKGLSERGMNPDHLLDLWKEGFEDLVAGRTPFVEQPADEVPAPDDDGFIRDMDEEPPVDDDGPSPW